MASRTSVAGQVFSEPGTSFVAKRPLSRTHSMRTVSMASARPSASPMKRLAVMQ